MNKLRNKAQFKEARRSALASPQSKANQLLRGNARDPYDCLSPAEYRELVASLVTVIRCWHRDEGTSPRILLSQHCPFCNRLRKLSLARFFAGKAPAGNERLWQDILAEVERVKNRMHGLKSNILVNIPCASCTAILMLYSSPRLHDARYGRATACNNRGCINPSPRQYDAAIAARDQRFKEFFQRFQICPICKKSNSEENLWDFYMENENIQNIKLRDAMLRSIDAEERKDAWVPVNVGFGIPCCYCFHKLLLPQGEFRITTGGENDDESGLMMFYQQLLQMLETPSDHAHRRIEIESTETPDYP